MLVFYVFDYFGPLLYTSVYLGDSLLCLLIKFSLLIKKKKKKKLKTSFSLPELGSQEKTKPVQIVELI